MHFLSDTPWKNARMEAFSQDASFRSYYRLHGGPRAALLMDAPPEKESVAPFVKIAEHLQKLSLSAPKIFGVDSSNGFALIEDFGDKTFTQLLAQGYSEKTLYLLATDCLIALHNNPDSTKVDVPQRETSFIEEVLLFCEWFYPALTGARCEKKVSDAFAEAWQGTLALRPVEPDVLVLRDFHIDNAMLLNDREGVQRCGLLDFQDATIGPAAYDVMSLLEDARRDVSPEVFSQCLELYLEKSNAVADNAQFLDDYAIIAAQRHTRVAGVFLRLSERDGKHHYLQHVPRVIRLLRKHLNHPKLSQLHEWFTRYYPAINDDDKLQSRFTSN